MSAKRATGRHAVLIDLENLLTSRRAGRVFGWVSSTDADRRIRRAMDAAGPSDFVWAAGNDGAWRVALHTLAELHIPGTVVGTGKDLADLELLRQADALPCDYSAITVVSGDEAFARLAQDPRVRLRVVAQSWQSVSRRLRLAAAETIVLDDLESARRTS